TGSRVGGGCGAGRRIGIDSVFSHGRRSFVLRSRLVSCFLFALFLHTALGSARAAGVPSASLRGNVYSEATNQPIEHATVWLCDDGGTQIQESRTTGSG